MAYPRLMEPLLHPDPQALEVNEIRSRIILAYGHLRIGAQFAFFPHRKKERLVRSIFLEEVFLNGDGGKYTKASDWAPFVVSDGL